MYFTSGCFAVMARKHSSSVAGGTPSGWAAVGERFGPIVLRAVDAQGNVRFTAGDLDFVGTASAGTLAGTYTSGGGKALDWSVSR